MWLIRHGERGQREKAALAEGLAILGWAELGDITACETADDLRKALRAAYPDDGKATISNWTGQLWRCLREIREGDLVVTPLKGQQKIAIGRVTGPYRYRPDALSGFRHVRPVEWLRTDIPRTAVQHDLRASMGSLLTVCKLARFGAARRIAHLAEHGNDPGPTPDEVDSYLETVSPQELLDKAIANWPKNPVRLTIRQFLQHWDVPRRTGSAIARIEADLVERGVTTRPPFTEGWLDNVIELVPVGEEPDREETRRLEQDIEDVLDLPAITLQIGVLESANRGVESVRPGDSLPIAFTKMLTNNYSQLAVIDDEGTLHGVVSWESISKARMSNPDAKLADATVPAGVVEYNEDLLGEINEIYAKGYVFVRGPDKKIAGIVTAADLTLQFSDLARPFVLIEEAERRLRRRVDEKFSLDEIRKVIVGKSISKVNSAADMTIGNYSYLLKPAEHWERLGWPLDHDLFLDLLDTVRVVRNELMHFTPDPLDPKSLASVEGFVNMLRTVDPRP